MNNANLLRRLTGSAAPLAVCLGLMSAPAFAQAVSTPANTGTTTSAAVQDEAEATGEDIVVTGTLVRNPNLVASSPVNVITAEEVDRRQVGTAEEFLRDIPGFIPSIGSAVNNGNGGASFANPRGLGTNRNVVLLDGARIAPAGLAGVVNLDNIPLALLERVDYSTGSAVTTYGADAIAGVVNFITRRDFAGVDIGLQSGITERGDGANFRADLSVGANFDDGRGNAVLSIGYQQRDPVYQGNRDISQFNIDSTSGLPGGSATAAPSVFNGVPGLGLVQVNPTGSALVPYYSPFNFNPQNIFQTPFERYNIFGQANYEVADNIEVYAQGMFSKNRVSTIIASSGTFSNGLTIPFSNPYLSAGIRSQFCTAYGLTADQCAAAATAATPTSPGYRTFTVSTLRRFVEAGPRFSEYTTTMFQYKGGVRGDITSNIGFDIFATYGESENVQRQSGNGLLSRLRNAVNATNVNTCLTDVANCVPLNLFGPSGSITPEQLSYLTGVTTSGTTQTSLATVRGVVNGDLGFSSPLASEGVGFAIGGEYRKYTAASVSDLATQTPGEVLGNGAASPDVTGEYDVKEAFVELVLPLISDRTLFQSLTLELGGRVSDYNLAGTSFTWKAGGSWEPINGLRIRGAYNRATRAPNIGELFSPPVTGLSSFSSDPCAGAAPLSNANLAAVCTAQGGGAFLGRITVPVAGQPNVTTSGNLNLDVEKATTWTVGAVLTPSFVPDLTVSVDYYNIVVTDAITTPSFEDQLNACFANLTAASAASAACTGIRRDPLSGALSGPVATTFGVPLPLSNLGRIETSGIDLAINYTRDLGFAGLNLSVIGTWVDKQRFQAGPNAINRECVGFYSINCESIQPEWQFSTRGTLNFGGADVSLLWRFIDAVQYEPLASGNPQQRFRNIDSFSYFDLTTRFELNDFANITFGVQNLLDKEPPLTGALIGATAYNSGNTYPSTYDAIGRRFVATTRLSF